MKNLFLVDDATGTTAADLIDYISNFKDISFVRKYTTRMTRESNQILNLLSFSSEFEFENENFEYKYLFGNQKYGFKKKHIDDAFQKYNNLFIIVSNQDIIKKLKKDFNYLNVVSIFTYTDMDRIRERLQEYGHTSEEIQIRLERSKTAYSSYLKNSNLYDQVLINNSSRENFKKIIDELLKKYISDKKVDFSDKNIKEELLLYLTLDGKIKPMPVFKDEMGNIIKKEEQLEIYFINKKKQKYEEKAEEFEYLISQEYIKEKELQKFFEQNPEFILDGEYCEAIPQVILKDENDKKNIPDFILKPNENISVPAKIVELKLPNVEVIHNYSRAEAFTQKITIAVGQLQKYYRYFNSDENRKKFLEKYHFQVFCPRLALIVGKDIVDIDKDTLNDLKTTFNRIDITTYNEVLANYRQKIKHLFK